ncbi:MAG: preprotein translocase subunit SecG [Clostridia bacterium]|nr:preprotein translocase subunit SecG [Clostridia bacterium]
MSWYLWLLGGLLIAASLFLIIVVLLQESKSAGLSGAISGGADTFFGKNKGRTIEAKLEKMTKVVATLFFVLAIATTFVLLFVFNK